MHPRFPNVQESLWCDHEDPSSLCRTLGAYSTLYAKPQRTEPPKLPSSQDHDLHRALLWVHVSLGEVPTCSLGSGVGVDWKQYCRQARPTQTHTFLTGFLLKSSSDREVESSRKSMFRGKVQGLGPCFRQVTLEPLECIPNQTIKAFNNT